MIYLPFFISPFLNKNKLNLTVSHSDIREEHASEMSLLAICIFSNENVQTDSIIDEFSIDTAKL